VIVGLAGPSFFSAGRIAAAAEQGRGQQECNRTEYPVDAFHGSSFLWNEAVHDDE
jgi:hypothetical protein